MRLIEGGFQETYSAMVLGRLEKVLQWEGGSIEAILAGGEPTPVGQVAESAQADPEGFDDLEERFRRIAADRRKRRELELAMRIIDERDAG